MKEVSARKRYDKEVATINVDIERGAGLWTHIDEDKPEWMDSCGVVWLEWRPEQRKYKKKVRAYNGKKKLPNLVLELLEEQGFEIDWIRNSDN